MTSGKIRAKFLILYKYYFHIDLCFSKNKKKTAANEQKKTHNKVFKPIIHLYKSMYYKFRILLLFFAFFKIYETQRFLFVTDNRSLFVSVNLSLNTLKKVY